MTKNPSAHHREICGIDVLLVRGRVKRMNLRVRPDGSVRLSIPSRCTIAEAERFVAAHLGWIRTQQERVARMQSADSGEAPRSEESIRRDKEELERVLPEIFAHYEALMGVSCSRWRLRHMVSRWGSCNVKTRVITINTELAHMPRACLESVVVHELCHLLDPHHDARFHALQDRYDPTWREQRAYLNAHPPVR